MTKAKNFESLREAELESMTGGATRGDLIGGGQEEAQFTGGVRVATGDVNGDGRAAKITFSDLLISSYQTSGSSG